jgi:ribulose-phosphate 3-epimerase
MHPALLAPSILAGDHASLQESLAVVEQHQLRWLHLDIMDGHFVPNLSFGPQTVADLRKRNDKLFFDTHLMLDNPHRYIDAFADAGADLITIHVEPEYDIPATLQAIRQRRCLCGLALNPDTPPESVLSYLGEVELILVMTVWPGFGGQSFIESTLPKMRQLAQWRQELGYSFRLEVDGGINLKTAELCKQHGVDTLVAGTAFFKSDDKPAFIQNINGLSTD